MKWSQQDTVTWRHGTYREHTNSLLFSDLRLEIVACGRRQRFHFSGCDESCPIVQYGFLQPKEYNEAMKA